MGNDPDRMMIMIDALIERNNMLEDRVQRVEWDLKFIRDWIAENDKTASPDAPQSTISGKGIP